MLKNRLFNWIPNLSIILVCFLQWFYTPANSFILSIDKLILFYWLIHRPDRTSLSWLCLFYLLGDVLEGLPFGSSSVLMLLCSWTILLQRHLILRQTFIVQWLFLFLILTLYLDAVAIVYFVAYSAKIPLLYMLFSGLFCFFLYPAVAFILYKLQRRMPVAET